MKNNTTIQQRNSYGGYDGGLIRVNRMLASRSTTRRSIHAK